MYSIYKRRRQPYQYIIIGWQVTDSSIWSTPLELPCASESFTWLIFTRCYNTLPLVKCLCPWQIKKCLTLWWSWCHFHMQWVKSVHNGDHNGLVRIFAHLSSQVVNFFFLPIPGVQHSLPCNKHTMYYRVNHFLISWRKLTEYVCLSLSVGTLLFPCTKWVVTNV